MAAVFAQQLAQNISCATWNRDGSLLAVCPNDCTVRVYRLEPCTNVLTLLQVLSGHHQLVSSLDWSCEGRLASASHDRTVVVWVCEGSKQQQQEEGQREAGEGGNGGGGSGSKGNNRLPTAAAADAASVVTAAGGGATWRAETVLARLSRSALCVRWSPDGRKLAAGGGSRGVTVCAWDANNGWYAGRPLKSKHSSSVTALAWHPKGYVLATASTDSTMRLYNAALPGACERVVKGVGVSRCLADRRHG